MPLHIDMSDYGGVFDAQLIGPAKSHYSGIIEYCKSESISTHCKMAEPLFVFAPFLLLSQLKFSAAINNVSQHFLGSKF